MVLRCSSSFAPIFLSFFVLFLFFLTLSSLLAKDFERTVASCLITDRLVIYMLSAQAFLRHPQNLVQSPSSFCLFSSYSENPIVKESFLDTHSCMLPFLHGFIDPLNVFSIRSTVSACWCLNRTSSIHTRIFTRESLMILFDVFLDLTDAIHVLYVLHDVCNWSLCYFEVLKLVLFAAIL